MILRVTLVTSQKIWEPCVSIATQAQAVQVSVAQRRNHQARCFQKQDMLRQGDAFGQSWPWTSWENHGFLRNF